jgi:hypothetical protein
MGDAWDFWKSGNMKKEKYFYVLSGLTGLKVTDPFLRCFSLWVRFFSNTMNKCFVVFVAVEGCGAREGLRCSQDLMLCVRD